MSALATLASFQQDHLLQFAAQLERDELAAFEQQLADIDFELLHRLTKDEEATVDWAALATRAEPPIAVRGAEVDKNRDRAIEVGEAAIRSGRVGMILVAGGQGTRLGFDQPKGLFPIGPLSDRTLFQMHCDRLLAVMQRYGVAIPLYVMTSPATDQETREYFSKNDRCGLDEDLLTIFCQGSMPAVDAESGKVLMASKSEIALSPDGHGGLVAALHKRGCLNDARARGIEHFYYVQVDNPMARICEPELIGFHILSESQMTTQVVKKRFAKEKVGNVVQIDGKTQIIEYSDLPDEIAEATDSQGELKFWAGNIAIHVFQREFLESVVDSADGLPFHRAHKAVAHLDASGLLVKPAGPNAIKFERFIFDLLPLADTAMVVEADAADVFAPVKNADGAAVDTPAHTKAAIVAQHRSWLQQAGVKIPPDVQVEIHPSWALDATEVRAKVQSELKIEADTYLR
ncbi:MAG: UDPGP type 1 family protein [Planctomycetales bacterium]|nr:UDPGP type 1 family protein [Planctomycetales bacterium]